MEKNYMYIVHYERCNILSRGEFSIVVYRDKPITTEADEENVKKLVRRQHIFSKCTMLWYALKKAPDNADASVHAMVNRRKPF